MNRGQTFNDALFAITGKTADAFASEFPARLKGSVSAFPGVALANDTQVGPGVTYTAYGFAASTGLDVTITAPGYHSVPAPHVTDMFGAYTGFMSRAAGWPLGTYVVTVSDGTTTVTATTILGP
jgi:hypothetical protein